MGAKGWGSSTSRRGRRWSRPVTLLRGLQLAAADGWMDEFLFLSVLL